MSDAVERVRNGSQIWRDALGVKKTTMRDEDRLELLALHDEAVRLLNRSAGTCLCDCKEESGCFAAAVRAFLAKVGGK